MIEVSFNLNGRPRVVSVDPSERLLDTLRYHLGFTGTKEGCGEGECGACTVLFDGTPANSCLIPTYQCRGRTVETVESVRPDELDALHTSGATQCGACTPGVVMTALWVRRNPEILATHSLRELMAGNLCRCTGYDGIIDGLRALLEEADAEIEGNPVGASHRAREPGGHPVSLLLPATVSEACEMLASHQGAVPVAGGTDLFVHWPQQLENRDRTFVDLSGLKDLRGHRWTDQELVLGGLTTYWDIIRDPRATSDLPLLVSAARQVGAIQIQTRGTWAGNIVNASPAADGVAVLMAYDAVVHLRSRDGNEVIPLSEFYLDYKATRRNPDQLLTEIRVPRRVFGFQMFEKVGSRAAQAITKVGVAVTRRDEEWRVVANSVAPTVCRCTSLEAFLAAEERVTGPEDLGDVIRRDVSPIDDIRSTARYRENVLARLLYFGLRGECPSFT